MECVAALHTDTVFQEDTHACRKVSSALVQPPTLERQHEIQLSVQKRGHIWSGRPRQLLLGKCCADLADLVLATKSYYQPNRSAFWALGPRRTSRRPPATRDTRSSARCSGRGEKQLEEQHPPRVKNFTGKISVKAGGSHNASLAATKQSTIGVQRWRRASLRTHA